jgi:hypothetical protein
MTVPAAYGMLVPVGGGTPIARLRPPRDPPGDGRPWFAALDAGEDDVDAIAACLADGAGGIYVDLVEGPAAVARLDGRIAVAEAIVGTADGATRILAAVASAGAVAALPAFGAPSRRLMALGLDLRGLSADLGLPEGDDAGAAMILARGLVVVAARVAGVPAFVRLGSGGDPARRWAAADGFALVLKPGTAPADGPNRGFPRRRS